MSFSSQLFNHRAKRGGSLFQGGSGERERGREATPPCGGEAPTKVAKRPFVGGGVPLRSPVFNGKVIQNMGRFERNLAEMVFGPCPTARVGGFAICVRMAE